MMTLHSRDLRDYQVHSSYRIIYSSELKWPQVQCYNAMQSKLSKCQWWVPDISQVLNPVPLFILGNSESNHQLLPHSHFPLHSRQTLGYLQQGCQYTPSVIKLFSDYCSSFNSRKSQSHSCGASVWHSHTI